MKWWFSDYDGTINLTHNDFIDPRDLTFIKKWISDGNKFAVATGRMEHEIRPILERAGVPYDYMICNNGAVVYEKEKGIIADAPIPKESRISIVQLFEKMREDFSIGYCLKDKRMSYSKVDNPEVYGNKFLEGYAPDKNNFDTGKEDILNSVDLNLLYFYISESNVDKVKKKLEGQIPGCKAVRTHKNVIEVMNSEVSKAYGIKIIQENKNFTDDLIYTSGDGENDIEMLKYTKNSFVMRNHQEGVDKFASYMIDNVYEIEKFLK